LIDGAVEVEDDGGNDDGINDDDGKDDPPTVVKAHEGGGGKARLGKLMGASHLSLKAVPRTNFGVKTPHNTPTAAYQSLPAKSPNAAAAAATASLLDGGKGVSALSTGHRGRRPVPQLAVEGEDAEAKHGGGSSSAGSSCTSSTRTSFNEQPAEQTGGGGTKMKATAGSLDIKAVLSSLPKRNSSLSRTLGNESGGDGGGPIMMVIEDAHWMDGSSWRVLSYVLGFPQGKVDHGLMALISMRRLEDYLPIVPMEVFIPLPPQKTNLSVVQHWGSVVPLFCNMQPACV
jgi:hypothetical protein